jgi:carboxylate-amine ligase
MNVSAHTVHYRGSDTFGWEGVYTHLQPVGGLQPYAASTEELVELQFARYYAWLEAMDNAGVERHLFSEAGGNLLKAAWNRVRLNNIGTVEMRGTDSNYPDVILALATLVYSAAERVRHENLTVIQLRKPVPLKLVEISFLYQTSSISMETYFMLSLPRESKTRR